MPDRYVSERAPVMETKALSYRGEKAGLALEYLQWEAISLGNFRREHNV